MKDNSGRVPSGNRLSSGDGAPSGLHPPGFDPARVLEFRPDDRGEFDEIVARFADGMVHVETMSDKGCYVGFYWDDGRYCQWWISSDKKLYYRHEDGHEQPPRFTAWGLDRQRDSDGSPKGGDACGSVEDDSAVPERQSPKDSQLDARMGEG